MTSNSEQGDLPVFRANEDEFRAFLRALLSAVPKDDRVVTIVGKNRDGTSFKREVAEAELSDLTGLASMRSAFIRVGSALGETSTVLFLRKRPSGSSYIIDAEDLAQLAQASEAIRAWGSDHKHGAAWLRKPWARNIGVLALMFAAIRWFQNDWAVPDAWAVALGAAGLAVLTAVVAVPSFTIHRSERKPDRGTENEPA